MPAGKPVRSGRSNCERAPFSSAHEPCERVPKVMGMRRFCKISTSGQRGAHLIHYKCVAHRTPDTLTGPVSVETRFEPLSGAKCARLPCSVVLPVPVSMKQETGEVVCVEFDGGSTCNIPRLGYGKGYGSYRVGEGAVRRVRFEGPMSANCAEILTLVAAITEAKRQGKRKLLLVGDSQIALKWANVAAGKRRATKIGKTSEGFQRAIVLLYQAARGLRIETRWQPREVSINTFGH